MVLIWVTIKNKIYFWIFSNFFFLSDGSYEITETEGVTRGTKIILHLKDDCNEFSKEDTIKSRF